MKKTTSIIALICATFITVSALSACGNKNDNQSSAAPVSSVEETKTDEVVTEAPTEPQLIQSAPLSEADIPDGTTADFEWISFGMPESYFEDTSVEPKYWIRLGCELNKFIQVDIKYGHYDGDIQEPVDERLKYATQGTDFELGGRTWTPVFYKEGSMDAICAFTPINDTCYLEVQAIGITEKDHPYCTILKTIEIDESQLK